MRTLQSYLPVVVCVAIAAFLPACASSSGDDSATSGPPSASRGATLYSSALLACNSCHGTDASGGIGPNITGSMTAGIGSWTETEFHNAVRNAKSKSGKALCFQMVAVPASAPSGMASVSDSGIADLFAFVTSQKNDTVNTGSGMCNTK